MSGLTHTDFPAFFRAVWGVDPFPWQADLLTRLATGEDARRGFACEPDKLGEWPAVLDLPTGAGKTAALDIALFHLALEAQARRAPVRIAFVVDRRLIVDDAYARAERLAEALGWSLLGAQEAAEVQGDLEARRPQLVDVFRRVRAEPVAKCVASRLLELAGPRQPPLVARRLRGGAPREDDWARTPVQPTILTSTVDQVGSRLLFRGYGISDSMKPVHAGLLGSDCLILLDEAHLSAPFRQTLKAVGRLRGGDTGRAPFGFAVLSATPGQEETDRFGLSGADEAHSVLSRRIEARKNARLVAKPSAKSDAARADAVAAEAEVVVGRLQATGIAHPAVGVVLNRVARARATFERIAGKLKDSANVILLIGPARAVDRNVLAERLAPIRTARGEARAALDKPLVIVATQTIEAGVDIDLDGLVTEAAALDALRQRFGRLNRAGRDIEPEAAILAFKDDLGAKADDPVYGDRIKLTWETLNALAGDTEAVDLGIRAMRGRIDEGDAARLAAPVENAPVLMPAYAHLWSQTAPIPNADPEVALFLHGPDRSPASVQIVWRADIDEDRDLKPAMREGAQGATRTRLIDLLKLMPPRAAEAIEVPLWAARAWLARRSTDLARFSDVVERPEQEGEAPPPAKPRCALLWAGEDSPRTGSVYGRALRNGDLIVVPAAYGGCDRWGWSPASDALVLDVADKAAEPYSRRRFAVRVTPELIVQELALLDDAADEAGREWAARLEGVLAEHAEERPARLLESVLALPLPPKATNALELLRDRPRGGLESFVYETADGAARGVAFLAPRGVDIGGSAVAPFATSSTESEEASAESEAPLGLAAHCRDVQAWAAAFARAAGLSQEMAGDIALAALLHDTGKADRRYQAYFAGGDPYGPDRGEPLAKTGGKRLPSGARERAGLPAHWRHEALSVRAAIAHPAFERAHDKLLVLWLIGTHHGHGRPLFPHEDPPSPDGKPPTLGLPDDLGGRLPLDDNKPGPQSLAFDFEGLDWAQAFEALKDKYGIWGLARLEAFVRLADHRASEAAAAPPQAAQDCKEATE
jgi:CRISPR-associated endonuclease/helicase Cas3